MAKGSRAKPLPQTAEEAGYEAQIYWELQQRLARIDVEEAEEIGRIRKEKEALREPLLRRCEALQEHVQYWAEANRAGRKSISLPGGRTVKWRRPSSPRLLVTGKLGTIVRSLMKRPNWEHYLKVELRKNNIKADPEVVKATPGLRLDDTEFFSIS